MADSSLRTRLLPLFRRSSASSAKSSASSTASIGDAHRSRSKTSLLLTPKGRKGSVDPVYEEEAEIVLPPPINPTPTYASEFHSIEPQEIADTSIGIDASKVIPPVQQEHPAVTLEEATPDPMRPLNAINELGPSQASRVQDDEADHGPSAQRPDVGPRKQPLGNNHHTRSITTLLEADRPHSRADSHDSPARTPTLAPNMLHRKTWVKRPGASATLVVIGEDDLVDDVREMILRKYANSLGRNFDAPDVTLRIVPRDHSHRHANSERTLGPEEPITRTLDTYYPGGQTVNEALLIDVPQRRTPRHSPRVHMPYYLNEDIRPLEGGTEYFPPMPVGASSPHPQSNLSAHSAQGNGHNSHAMSIINTGMPPPLPSPGSRTIRHGQPRPKYGRTHTTSPIVPSAAAGHSDNRASHVSNLTSSQNLPTPPLPAAQQQRALTPPPRVSSPRPIKTNRPSKKSARNQPNLPKGLLDGAVPPINVLIVEDNIINLKLLEAFMKRLKVRWQTAMNGREAVNKWRAGGFHLVLMDIQLPVMNGLEATKEIRRLERVNEIGVLAGPISGRSSVTGTRSVDDDGAGKTPDETEEAVGEDRLMNTELFKSPVIIVALTASSLQSDRHEALAAGCNDFLTKPVNFVWLERKVMEWGCMQALIDFDGWRKWKDFSQTPAGAKPTPVPPQLLNNSSGSTVASLNSIHDSINDSPKLAMNARGTLTGSKIGMGGSRVMDSGNGLATNDSASSGDTSSGNSSVTPVPRTGRRAKRTSLGRGGMLSGVTEDSGEQVPRVGKEITTGA